VGVVDDERGVVLFGQVGQLRSGPSSPSMEKIPSVIIRRRRQACASWSAFSTPARSPCGVMNRFALQRRTPSMIEAWFSPSVRRASSSARSGWKRPSLAFQHDM